LEELPLRQRTREGLVQCDVAHQCLLRAREGYWAVLRRGNLEAAHVSSRCQI
jgi:hypothetical protein